MAYDETFQALPRFIPDEVGGVSIPEVYLGQMRSIKGVLRLAKVKTSPEIDYYLEEEAKEGKTMAPRLSLKFKKDGELHSVAWVGSVSEQYQLICDCIAGYDFRSDIMGDDILYCDSVQEAINFRANKVRDRLANQDLLHRHGDRNTIKKMLGFIIDYSQKNPDIWVANHRSGTALIGGLAQTIGRTFDETKDIIYEMEANGLVTTSGEGGQIVSLL